MWRGIKTTSNKHDMCQSKINLHLNLDGLFSLLVGLLFWLCSNRLVTPKTILWKRWPLTPFFAVDLYKEMKYFGIKQKRIHNVIHNREHWSNQYFYGRHEPQCQRTYLQTCAPWRFWSDCACAFTGRISGRQRYKFLHADNDASDKRVRICWLIWVLVGRTCQTVWVLTLWNI